MIVLACSFNWDVVTYWVHSRLFCAFVVFSSRNERGDDGVAAGVSYSGKSRVRVQR